MASIKYKFKRGDAKQLKGITPEVAIGHLNELADKHDGQLTASKVLDENLDEERNRKLVDHFIDEIPGGKAN